MPILSISGKSLPGNAEGIINPGIQKKNEVIALEARRKGVKNMGVKENRALIERWYTALYEGDFETMMSMHPEDVIFNMIGNTPVSGRYVGKDVAFGIIIAQVVNSLVPETVKFGKKWKIMAADDQRVVGIMQGGGMGKNGEEYAQTYCHIFTIKGGLIVELHDFFDTVLAEKVVFDNHLERPETPPADPFNF
jgi:uncharacterized protein